MKSRVKDRSQESADPERKSRSAKWIFPRDSWRGGNVCPFKPILDFKTDFCDLTGGLFCSL